MCTRYKGLGLGTIYFDQAASSKHRDRGRVYTQRALALALPRTAAQRCSALSSFPDISELYVCSRCVLLKFACMCTCTCSMLLDCSLHSVCPLAEVYSSLELGFVLGVRLPLEKQKNKQNKHCRHH